MKNIIRTSVAIALFAGVTLTLAIVGETRTSATQTTKTDSGGKYSASVSFTFCPVVGDGNMVAGTEADYALVANNEAPIYEHCMECRAGVYSEHEDGVVSCTFCKAVKKQNNE